MNLEEIYSSKIRQRIIEALSQNNHLPVTKLNHITGGSYSGLSPHLLILEKEGIIKSEYQKLPKQPKTRTITLLKNNPRTQKLIKTQKNLKEENVLL
jgi:DNA-binding transcriptional ArsR family regulator